MNQHQTILAVDESGKFLEYIPKELGHTGEGKRHLAITVLVYNSKNEVLLQRRKHKVFDNIWEFSASTHPLHHGKKKDETIEQATLRALKDEYGIENINVENLGFFNYFAKKDGLCENEHCAMMVGEYEGKIKMDSSVGYEYKWVDLTEFINDVEKNPKKYAPWTQEGVKVLKKEFICDCC